jgi:hypothetical protein
MVTITIGQTSIVNGLGQRVFKAVPPGSEYSLYGPGGKRIATLNGGDAFAAPQPGSQRDHADRQPAGPPC